jgi:hypothetical protein
MVHLTISYNPNMISDFLGGKFFSILWKRILEKEHFVSISMWFWKKMQQLPKMWKGA